MFFWKNSVVKDAEKIQQAIDYRIIRAAWDEYITIQSHQHHNYSKAYGVVTPAWYALQAIQDHKGKFRAFPKDEIKFLYALLEAHDAYAEISQVLKVHGAEKMETDSLFSTHPQLYSVLSTKCANTQEAVDYIIGVLDEYQKMLDVFAGKYGNRIRRAIALLEKKEVKKKEALR